MTSNPYRAAPPSPKVASRVPAAPWLRRAVAFAPRWLGGRALGERLKAHYERQVAMADAEQQWRRDILMDLMTVAAEREYEKASIRRLSVLIRLCILEGWRDSVRVFTELRRKLIARQPVDS